MADLIDRDKLIDHIMESYPDWCVKPVRPIFDFINGMPSSDAIEVVRCADCKHWDIFDIHSTICPDNRRCKGIIGKMYTAPDYYCAYGERKNV